MSMMNEMVRQLLTAYIEEQFTDPALREKMVPPYPPLAKRVVRDDGSWAAALQQDHVSRSEEHTSELQSLMRISYAVFCLKKKKKHITISIHTKHDQYGQ